MLFLGNPMLKATTIQSFKGYEAKAIALYISKMQDEELTYVGLTRLKENSEGNFITNINANPKFDNFVISGIGHLHLVHQVVIRSNHMS